ncbi:MAG TPA: histidine ammonia-lyase [Syntrophomonas sp.]|nr:histidine ammonia-lyase [Syntrophomonas sp.]
MIKLTGNSLTLKEVEAVLYGYEEITIDESSWEKVDASRQVVEQIVADEQLVYGITTGFGKFSDVLIKSEYVEELQLNLIHSHACGVGEKFPEIVSRAMLLLRANTLLKGFSGARRELIQMLVKMLNARIHPVIPQQGSLGASGDLIPLAHLALALLGEGEVAYRGKICPAIEALNAEGIKPIALQAKEGLALINGTQAMTAMGVLAYLEAEKIAYQAEFIAAISIEGLQGITDAFEEDVQLARGYTEQLEVARRLRKILGGSQLTTHAAELRVQDAYSLRCIPQVFGASWQALAYVRDKLEIEINAATDNPLIFENGKVISGGNFHGQPIALAMDLLKIAMAELANISERRIEQLINPSLNDLPAFLSPQPGLQSGAMILQYCAASLVSENKTLAHPASVDSIPSSANQEDHVSMGTIASRHAYQIIQNTRQVLAIELICALQAVDFRGVDKMAPITRGIYAEARKVTPSIIKDRIFSYDIEKVNNWMMGKGFNIKLD